MKKNLVLFCRSVVVSAPTPRLELTMEVIEQPGSVSTFTENVEAVDRTLVIRDLSYVIATPSCPGGADGSRKATMKVVLTGETPSLLRVQELAQSGRILSPRTAEQSRLIESATPLVEMPLTAQTKLHIRAATWDAVGLTGEACKPLLQERGTIHSLIAVTVNSGDSPGTPDYVMDFVVGFACVRDAKRAERKLNQLGFREVTVTRLFDDLSDGGSMVRLAA